MYVNVKICSVCHHAPDLSGLPREKRGEFAPYEGTSAYRGIPLETMADVSKAYPAAFLHADRIYTRVATADCTYSAREAGGRRCTPSEKLIIFLLYKSNARPSTVPTVVSAFRIVR